MRRLQQSESEGTTATETQGMIAVGEMPARDMEFEELLRNAAELQKDDIGCKLRGEIR